MTTDQILKIIIFLATPILLGCMFACITGYLNLIIHMYELHLQKKKKQAKVSNKKYDAE